jgi:signal transduction histidine kinase
MKRLAVVRRLIERHPFASDAALAVAVAAFVQFDIWTSGDYLTASKAVYVPAALLMTLPLAWRRRAPLAVVVIVMAALIFESLAVGSAPTPDSPLIAWLLAIYSVAAHCDRRRALVGGAVSLIAGTVWIGLDDVFFPIVVFGGAWLAGRLVRQRQVHAVTLQERAAALERAREANARAAAADERARIARELHDILAHSLSLIVVQAGAERMALGTDRAATGEALDAIERTGREALAETRRLLGIVRGDGEALRPQPTLADLEELVSQVRDRGLPVELRIEGEAVSVPPGIALSAYRIVQEALTNVIKHAGPARAHVVVRYEQRELELEVADDGRGPSAGTAAGNGHGLVGMRERVALYGGDLAASAGSGGGFVVRARLPLAPAGP